MIVHAELHIRENYGHGISHKAPRLSVACPHSERAVDVGRGNSRRIVGSLHGLQQVCCRPQPIDKRAACSAADMWLLGQVPYRGPRAQGGVRQDHSIGEGKIIYTLSV